MGETVYLFRCGIDGSSGLKDWDLRGDVGRRDHLWGGLRRGAERMEGGVSLWSRCQLGSKR